jgi:hypothetical protein
MILGVNHMKEHFSKDNPCASLVVKHYILFEYVSQTLVGQKGWAIFHLDVQQHFWQGVNLNIRRVFKFKG